MHVRIYTDGGSRGNPGPSASAAVVKSLQGQKEGEVLAKVAKYLGITTNNQAEYTAIIIGLEEAKKRKATHVDMVMDSELAVKQLNGLYRVKNEGLIPLFLTISRLKTFFASVTFRHVRREFNKEADALVNETLDAHM